MESDQGGYVLLRPVGIDIPSRGSVRRIVACAAAGVMLALFVVLALSSSGGTSFPDRVVKSLAVSALDEWEESDIYTPTNYSMYQYAWVSTMKDNVRFPEDLIRPYGEAPGYFGEWSRKSSGSSSLPWQWAGWQQTIPSGKFAKMCAWIQFVDSVPAPSYNFGFKMQGSLVNQWVSSAKADEWSYVHAIAPTHEGGDGDHFLLIFDSVAGPATVQCPFPSFRPPPFPRLPTFNSHPLLGA